VPSAYRVELTPPDIGPYRAGNTGIEYVTTFDSGIPGPHVVVNALTHGNELCGAIAVDRLFQAGIRPERGRLTLSFANVAAYLSFDPGCPGASRAIDEDFNRLWDGRTLDGPRMSNELRRARVLRPLFESADLLLDIHSMQHTTAPLMLAGPIDKTVAFAQRLGVPAFIVRDAGHAAGKRLRDYGAFSDPAAPQMALLVECGQHWERRAADVAIDTTWRFLAASGILPGPEADRVLTQPAPAQRVITVTDVITVAYDQFRFAADYRGLEVIAQAGTMIARDGPREIRTPYDDCVLIMPSRRLSRGQTAVRLGRFTE
jgi:predicted deacylase